MKCLKCFHEKKSFLFFVLIKLEDEKQYLKTIDILLDMKLKIKEIDFQTMEEQNPFFQKKYDIFVFEEETVLDYEMISNFILEKSHKND